MPRPEIRCHLEKEQVDNVSPTNEKRTQRDYNLGFKLAVEDEIEKGEFKYKQAQKIYGIHGHSTALSWLRTHDKTGLVPIKKVANELFEIPSETEYPSISCSYGIMIDVTYHFQRA